MSVNKLIVLPDSLFLAKVFNELMTLFDSYCGVFVYTVIDFCMQELVKHSLHLPIPFFCWDPIAVMPIVIDSHKLTPES